MRKKITRASTPKISLARTIVTKASCRLSRSPTRNLNLRMLILHLPQSNVLFKNSTHSAVYATTWLAYLTISSARPSVTGRFSFEGSSVAHRRSYECWKNSSTISGVVCFKESIAQSKRDQERSKAGRSTVSLCTYILTTISGSTWDIGSEGASGHGTRLIEPDFKTITLVLCMMQAINRSSCLSLDWTTAKRQARS
jgi:hypothetical protein